MNTQHECMKYKKFYGFPQCSKGSRGLPKPNKDISYENAPMTSNLVLYRKIGKMERQTGPQAKTETEIKYD